MVNRANRNCKVDVGLGFYEYFTLIEKYWHYVLAESDDVVCENVMDLIAKFCNIPFTTPVVYANP
eukprot:TRINITY_DN5669_c0_g1_i1.p2 TRINITY_DN5669_c0_g1~~TRINITY_DN5669_c0_g1_i1.p2  ORF type:complete len:65 (-),score=9.21 TRINITY_DN5669_c0_g1_i1:109-303(-)